MKRATLLIGIVLYTLQLNAQSGKEFGDSLFTAIQQDTITWDRWFITLKQYHQLVDRQRKMDRNTKDEFKIKINDSYNSQFKKFKVEMEEIMAEYSIEQVEAHYELAKVETEALENLEDIYYFRLFITYYWKKKHDQFVLEFQATFLNGRWIMMQPLQEYYQ